MTKFIVLLLLSLSVCSFGQQIEDEQIYPSLIRRDSLVINRLSAVKNIKRIDFYNLSDTLIVKVKTGLFILKKKDNKILIEKNINFIKINEFEFFIQTDLEKQTWYLIPMRMIKI